MTPAIEPEAKSYVNMHNDTGNARTRESFGMPIKKLVTAIQEARQVNIENTLFQVNTVETTATVMNMGSQIIPPFFFGSRFINTNSLNAAIAATAAPEYAPIKQ
jgi:hypothetical protein